MLVTVSAWRCRLSVVCLLIARLCVCALCVFVLAGVEAEGEGGEDRKDSQGGGAAELHQGPDREAGTT